MTVHTVINDLVTGQIGFVEFTHVSARVAVVLRLALVEI